MPITIHTFGGQVEKLAPKLLKESLATLANSVRIDSGQLSPFRESTLVTALTLADPKTIYRYPSDKWFEWNEDVDVAKTPVAYDSTDMIVFTGQDYPRITRNDIALGAGRLPLASYRLGVPAPSTAPTVAETTPSSDPDALDEDRYYVYTYVDAWGREGPPSDISTYLTTKDGATITVTMGATPTGNYNFGAGALRRIYRTNTGTSATAFQFVAEVAIATTSYVDSVLNANLAEVIPSTDWDGPPDDDSALYPAGPMQGLCALPNGVLAGFAGNTVCFSEPYLPHSWPVAYRYATNDSVVAVVPVPSGLAVFTVGKPYLMIGTDPASMAAVQLDQMQACVSKRSAVDMGDYAIYASPDGLMGVDQSTVRNLTDSIFTREQWQAKNPGQIRAFRYEDKYVAFNDTAGFIFSPTGLADGSGYIELDFTADGGYYDPLEDTLYLAIDGSVYSFDTGAARTYEWKSKVFFSGWNQSYSYGKLVADAYPVSLDIYVDDAFATTITVSNAEPFPLPVLTGTSWQFGIRGTAVVDMLAIGTSMKEVGNV